MANSDNGTGFGISHLSDMPITVTFGVALIVVIALLVLLRYFFADVTVKGGTR